MAENIVPPYCNVEPKLDSPEKLAQVANKPTEQYLFAPEINLIVDKINSLKQQLNAMSTTAENDANNQIVTLGEIGTLPIHQVVRNLDPARSIQANYLRIFKALRNGVVDNYLYTGSGGLVGLGNVQPEANDFYAISGNFLNGGEILVHDPTAAPDEVVTILQVALNNLYAAIVNGGGSGSVVTRPTKFVDLSSPYQTYDVVSEDAGLFVYMQKAGWITIPLGFPISTELVFHSAQFNITISGGYEESYENEGLENEKYISKTVLIDGDILVLAASTVTVRKIKEDVYEDEYSKIVTEFWAATREGGGNGTSLEYIRQTAEGVMSNSTKHYSFSLKKLCAHSWDDNVPFRVCATGVSRSRKENIDIEVFDDGFVPQLAPLNSTPEYTIFNHIEIVENKHSYCKFRVYDSLVFPDLPLGFGYRITTTSDLSNVVASGAIAGQFATPKRVNDIVIQNLIFSTDYYIHVRLERQTDPEANSSVWIKKQFRTEPLAAPSFISINTILDTSVKLFFGALAQVTQVYTDVSTSSNFSSLLVFNQPTDSGTLMYTTINGLSPNTTYYVRSRLTGVGGDGQYTTENSPTTQFRTKWQLP